MDGKAHYISLNLDSSSYFLFYTGTVLFGTSAWRSECACRVRLAQELSEQWFAFLKAGSCFHLVKELFKAKKRGDTLLLKLRLVPCCNTLI